MSMEITKYEAACKAVAEAHRVDEVKDIRDKHIAIMEYAKQSKNFELEKQAMEIRLRAERKGGELLIDLKPIRDSGKIHEKGKQADFPKTHSITSVSPESPEITPVKPKSKPTPPKKPNLFDLGVDKYLSSQMQKLAKMPEAKFEEHIGKEKDKIDRKNTQQIKAEEAAIKRKVREEKRMEKEKIKEQKEIYDKMVDESDFSPKVKSMLKGKRVPPNIDSFANEFIDSIKNNQEKLKELMLYSEHLGTYQRVMLARELGILGKMFIEAEEILRMKLKVVE
jgi:hypothetical protein